MNHKQRRTQKDRLFTRILDDFDSTREVRLASTTLHLVDAPALGVRLSGYEQPEPKKI